MITRLSALFLAAGLGSVALAGPAVTPDKLYENHCAACHQLGVAGAPKIDDKAAWLPRIQQGNAVLYQHAINGFDGATGSMPPKGGFSDLSDEQVKTIVEYMVSRVQE